MKKIFIFASFCLLLLFAVSTINGKCCGRGKHGFCEDCARVSLFGHRKCCGSGSGYGHGCNIFCCNCGSCRKGHAEIIYSKYGHKYHGKYTCKQGKKYYHEDEQESDSDRDTWKVFNKMDRNDDVAISPDEFLDAMKARLLDRTNARIVASHLLRSSDREDVSAFLDSLANAADDEYDDDAIEKNGEARDVIRTLAREFVRMDLDGDGLIQASEFDKDLE